MPLIIFVVLALIIGFILTKMAFGKKLYMIGSNATAAKFSGLNSVSLLVRTYALSGLCAGVAGLAGQALLQELVRRRDARVYAVELDEVEEHYLEEGHVAALVLPVVMNWDGCSRLLVCSPE